MSLQKRFLFAAATLTLACGSSALAQQITGASPVEVQREATKLELPEAPGFVMKREAEAARGESSSLEQFGGKLPRVTPTVNGHRYRRIIHPGGYAPPLTAGDKLKLSIVSRLSVVEIGTTLYSAGIGQYRNSKPHYGDDAGAFGQRFGAIALKHVSQAFFSYGLYAAAFHEDPRYYVLGREHKVVNRVVYSALRLFITRNDAGNSTFNYAKIAGLASSNALTNAYYPEVDRGGAEFAKSMGTSLYGTVINNEIHEFIGDLKDLIFHKKQ